MLSFFSSSWLVDSFMCNQSYHLFSREREEKESTAIDKKDL